MLRALILSLILFVAFGTLVPISTEYSEASVVTSQRKYKKKKRAEKYRRMAIRQKRNRSTSKTLIAKKTKTRSVKSKSKSRKVSRHYRASKSQPRRSVRKKRKAKRSTAKRRVRKSSRSKRAVRSKRKVRRSARARRSTKRRYTKRRYTAKKRKRSTSRRSARKRTPARRVQKKRGVRKYSKKWWANYRAQQRRKKAVASIKRTNRIKTIRLAKMKVADTTPASVRYERLAAFPAASAAAVRTQVQSPNDPVQEFQMVSGDVSMDVIGASRGDTVTRGRNTMVGGVSTVTLRRTVIEQMIQESGWVENDYQKEVDGKQVYVVVAKAPDKNNRIKAKTYYFTESNGRIYRVAANSNSESTEAAQNRSEEMIRKLDKAAKPQQAQNQ